MARPFEQQIKTTVDQALLVHALAHTGFVEQVHAHLLQHAGPDAREHVVAALPLHDDGVDAGLEQQLAQQQAGRACANDGHLGAGGAHEVSPEIGQCNAVKLKRWGCFARMVVMKFVRLTVNLCDDRAK